MGSRRPVTNQLPNPAIASGEIRILIVGCGAVVEELHAPALLELKERFNVSVVALLDPDSARRSAMKRQFPSAFELGALGDLAEVNCNAALIASPARFHAEQTIACLNAGLSVLCEKPMSVTVDEAELMVNAAERNARLLAVGHFRRHFAASRLIKDIIEKGRFGRPLKFRAVEGSSFRWAATTSSFFDKRVAGGGVLTDTGVHTLDLILWWFGLPRSFSYADDAMGGVEANCRLALNYGDFGGEIQLTRDYDLAQGYRLEFEQAWIYWRPVHPRFF